MRPGLFFLARWAICSALLVGGAPALAQQAGGQLGGQQQPGIQQPASRPAAATRLPGARSARVTPRSTADAGLPPLVALPLFLGEAKFSNPQVGVSGCSSTHSFQHCNAVWCCVVARLAHRAVRVEQPPDCALGSRTKAATHTANNAAGC